MGRQIGAERPGDAREGGREWYCTAKLHLYTHRHPYSWCLSIINTCVMLKHHMLTKATQFATQRSGASDDVP